MMQGGSMHQDWRITADDRVKHDNQFNQLKPVNGFITGDAARGFFMQSGLPQQVLGHIWMLSDMNSDGKLDKLEFSIAMYLIKKKLSGVELPRTLPPSLKQAPAQSMSGFGVQPMGMVRPMGGGFAGGMPATGAMPGIATMPSGGAMQPGSYNTLPNRSTPSLGGFGAGSAQQNAMARAGSVQASPERARSSSITADWGVPHNSKLKFTQMFNTQDRTRSGFLTGAQARNVLVQSGLGQAHLAQIWGLSDVDNDGKLTCEEFCLALHLVDMIKSGKPLPAKLPPDLVPPSYRRSRSSSITSSGGGAAAGPPPTPAPAPAMPTATMMANIGGGLGQAPMGGMPVGGAPMMPTTMPGALPGGVAGQGGFGGMGAPLSPALPKQQSVDEQPPAEEKAFTPVSFEDRKRQNFEKGQQELERRRAALREVQEREKERQREIEKQEQERKERIRLEQERRRQLELERMMQKQREIEAEREAQRMKLEQQREAASRELKRQREMEIERQTKKELEAKIIKAARRELERQRQMEIERQKRQELEAKRIKSQEEVCHLKATSKTLACEMETLEDKKNELNKKINESHGFVQEHQTSIILMGKNRDVKVAEIEQLQQRIQEVRQLKQQRAQQKEELQVQAKKLNINPQVSDTYAAVMTSYDNKQKTLVKLRAALEEVERKTESSLHNTDNNHSKLAELKANLVREQNEIDQLQKQFKVKMADFNMVKKRLEDQKKHALIKQNQQNEKIRLEALQKKKEEEESQKKFEAIRLAQQQAEKADEEKKRKEEEKKAQENAKPKNDDPFAAFGSSGGDPFSSAFDSKEVTNTDPNDPFAAFSGSSSVQSTKSDSDKKDPFAAFGDFSNSTFDFGQTSFKPQQSSTTSSNAATTVTSTSSASLATSFTPTPQPRTITAPATKSAIKQPSLAAPSQPSPLTIQPTVGAVVASQPSQNETTPEPSSMVDNTKPAPLSKELKSVLSQYKALYQFDAEGPDELSIKPGDIILVGKNQGGEPGWLGGELNGRTGWFPENYAEKLPSPPTTPRKPENNGVITKTDTPSWASFGDKRMSLEAKQQSAASTASVSATSSFTTTTPAPVSTTLTPSPVPDAAPVATSSPSPALASQEPTQPKTKENTPSSTPSPAPAPSRSVAALTAAFTAAAEASTVPQASKSKPMEELKGSDQTSGQADDPVYDVIGDSEPKVKAAEGQSSFAKFVPQAGATPSPVPNQGTIPPAGTQVKAMYDWDAKKDNHLSFKAGETITVLEKQDMWWLGEIDGRKGWFPKAHVQFLEESVPEGSSHNFRSVTDNNAIYANTPKPQAEEPFALYANTPKITKQPSPPPPTVQQVQEQVTPGVISQENSAPPQQDDAVKQDQQNSSDCVALYTYTSDEPSDLTFEAGEHITIIEKDGEWWTGQIGERKGIFPSNYVQESQSQGSQPEGTSSSGLSPAAPVVPADVAAKSGSLARKPEIAKVLASYEATGAEQLSLTAGQLIMVRKKNASGWWEGELQARGKKRQIGWFPANYVKLMESSGSLPREATKSPSVLTAPSQSNQRLTPGIDMVCQVITIYPYTQQNDDELSFQKGMVINVLSKDDPDWWKGELNGTKGVFPSNYVQELGDSKSVPATDWTHDVHLLESMSEMEQHRQGRIHELIQTEQAYVEDMQLAVEVFQKPMLESQVMTPQEMAAVFVNWKELIQCNTKLLKALRVRKKMSGEDKPVHMIGDILCEQLPRMTSYIRFCSCQLSASNVLSKKIEGDPDFKEYVKKLATDVRTKGMPVSSYLIKPMQRITRYPLLTQKILKYTPENHADYANMKTACEKAEELCQQVNEGVREKENSDKLEWLQNHVDCTGLAEELIFNSLTNCLGPRKYLHSGKLNKAKSNKELYVFLFNDFLLFTQPVKSGLPTPFTTSDNKNVIEYKMYKHPLFLNEVDLKIPSDAAADEFVFHINHIDKVYALRAETNNDRNRWKDKIEKASKHYVETEKKKREKLQRVRSMRSKGVGRLMVVIIEGFDLKPSNSVTGRADPYCEVSMGSQEHKTKVVPDNLNPIWDSSMQFIVRDLEQDVLCITVYDRDFFSPNDFLGRTEVRVADILRETQGRGPMTKRLLLHEVSTGEVKVKLTLHLFDQS